LDLIRTLQVIFGIGLVIFVHEGGHFIAARLCKVRVDVFSLGFGPKLFGWRRGATLYQVAMVPIGGYVKMAGEMPDGSGRPPRGDELWSKSVWQRFFIYSGGVLMNVVFALVAFPFILTAGVPLPPPIIGAPSPGSPAWFAGLEPGTEIVAVDGEPMFDFANIYTAVALADDGPLRFTVRDPGQTATREVVIRPEKDEDSQIFMIGVPPAYRLDGRLTVEEGRAGYEAGLRSGDILVGVDGGLPSQSPQEQLRGALLSNEPFTLLARRDGAPIRAEITADEEPAKGRKFGFGALQNMVKGVRPNPDLDSLGLEVGQRIIAVDGRPVAKPQDWLAALLAAQAAPTVQVQDAEGASRFLTFARPLDGAAAVQAARDLHMTLDPQSTLLEIGPDQPSFAAGLRTGDRLRALDGHEVEDWKGILGLAGRLSKSGDEVKVAYQRRDGDGIWRGHETTVTPDAPTVQIFGFGLEREIKIYRADSVGESITQGFSASWRFLAEAWLTVKKMVLGRVGTKNMGGIITISQVSYSWASEGWAKLFFFLCMLSINLAFLNVLPIPILDGGHLFFCLVEAVKGSPVSERTLGYSQVVGLVVILTLMVYVTYNDVLRTFLG
jgi:regulator of sigma E protease